MWKISLQLEQAKEKISKLTEENANLTAQLEKDDKSSAAGAASTPTAEPVPAALKQPESPQKQEGTAGKVAYRRQSP